MTDHVARMVNGWLDSQRQGERSAGEPVQVARLVDAIHRLIREAERETQLRCEEIARRAADRGDAGEVALAIRALGRSHARRTHDDGAPGST